MFVKKKNYSSWIVLACSLVIVFGLGLLGSLFTSTELEDESWYASVRPSITPPSYVFPIVWNVLFALIALALWISWMNGSKRDKRVIIGWYGANLFLNVLWSMLYFGMHRPGLAFIDLVILWGTIIGMMITTYRITPKATLLLAPYLLWVSFAGVLNYLSIG